MGKPKHRSERKGRIFSIFFTSRLLADTCKRYKNNSQIVLIAFLLQNQRKKTRNRNHFDSRKRSVQILLLKILKFTFDKQFKSKNISKKSYASVKD